MGGVNALVFHRRRPGGMMTITIEGPNIIKIYSLFYSTHKGPPKLAKKILYC